MNFDSEPIYHAALSCEFTDAEDRERFLGAVRDLLTPRELRNVELKTRASCCRLCGISGKFHTLGSGAASAWDAVDECRVSYAMSCLRRQKAVISERLSQ